ncbi:prepilin-type N-terminal cleavage/methylation domain-containing protein [bacterium]|nr:prepilin-type N-terminal cleavage/methylation domain-containing protein [bacterium]
MKRNKGVTLIELLVVIAIIALLAGLTILRIATPKYSVELDSAANMLKSSLVQARDVARSPKATGTISDANTLNGYGVVLPSINTENPTFKVYRDAIDTTTPVNQNKWVLPSSTSPDALDDTSITDYDPLGGDIRNIILLSYSIDGVDDTNSGIRDIFFSSKDTPSQERVFYNNTLFLDAISITLKHKITNKTITIFVTSREEIIIVDYVPTPGNTPSEFVGTSYIAGDQRSGGDYDYSEFRQYVPYTFPSIITSWGERQNGSYYAPFWTNISEVFTDNGSGAYLTWPNGWNDRGYLIADYGIPQGFSNLSVKFWTNNGSGNYPKVIVAISEDSIIWKTIYFKQWPANSAPTSPYLITASLGGMNPRYIQLYYIMSGGGCAGGTCTGTFDGLRLY